MIKKYTKNSNPNQRPSRENSDWSFFCSSAKSARHPFEVPGSDKAFAPSFGFWAERNVNA